MDIVAAIIPYILAVFIIIKICIVEARNKREEIEEIEEIEREFERKERKKREKLEKLEREEREEREKLEKLTQQKEEIEKQVFKEDEYNLYVNEGIIEKMCLLRLRKEYTDHSYILYKKLLEDIKIATREFGSPEFFLVNFL